MRRFRFTLQALLIVLEQKEHAALTAYARSLDDQRKATEQWREAQRVCEEAFRLGRERAVTGAPAVHLAQLQEYCRSVKEFEQLRLEDVRRADRSVDGALARLLSARRSRESVDRVRRAQRQRYDHECHREEQKLLDDLAQHAGVAAEGSSGEFEE
ncbi:MAG TPA: flagellar FliJ family protein [Verrucomicrobiae bacterium]|nr:flagellar FliJ family protein [Verrucomicrobiae bacterium]